MTKRFCRGGVCGKEKKGEPHQKKKEKKPVKRAHVSASAAVLTCSTFLQKIFEVKKSR